METQGNCSVIILNGTNAFRTERAPGIISTQYDRLIEHLSYIIETDRFGTTRYRNRDGQLHRIDGPALEWYSGTQEWYKNGVLHRTDGPAVMRAGDSKEWYHNGVRHRENGPAVEFPTDNMYFLYGKLMSEADHLKTCH